MKCFITGGSKKWEQKKKPEAEAGNTGEKDGSFPSLDGYLMIFGGPETLDAMGIDRSRIRPTKAPFHGIVLGKQAIPIEQIDLPITFGNPSNYRIETLTLKRAYECEVESCELTLATLASEELAAIGKDIAEGALDTKQVAGSFEPMKNIKEVLVNPNNSTNKTVRIGIALSPK
ncbi:uncharacterized protein [Miscanthus floridulus]|uniref:uncharacterized protein n=1 Tax=Miscanthus floridulus TaxID=154761 RepID=UPI00345AF783